MCIRDRHLSPRSPGATRLFLTYLAGAAQTAEALYILGDFFDAWIGDDDCTETYHAEIIAALRAASDAGLNIHLDVYKRQAPVAPLTRGDASVPNLSGRSSTNRRGAVYPRRFF